MAELVNKQDVGNRRLPLCRIRLLDGGRGEHYPFDAWADGRWRRARPGVDFFASSESFKVSLYRWARRWTTSVQFASDDQGGILFKLEPLDPARQSARDYAYGPILYNFEQARGY